MTGAPAWPEPSAIAAQCRAVMGEGPGEGVLVDGPAVRRLGLGLGAHAGLDGWLEAEGIDALLLHRSHGYAQPAGVALLGYHDAFDETLGLHGPPVAAALGTHDRRLLDPKLAVVGTDPGVIERAQRLFGGWDELRAGAGGVVRSAALASALRPELVTVAAQAGASLYVTGQWRPSAARAVAETGMAVLVVGHRRAERWALGHLAGELRTRLAGLEVVVDPAA